MGVPPDPVVVTHRCYMSIYGPVFAYIGFPSIPLFMAYVGFPSIPRQAPFPTFDCLKKSAAERSEARRATFPSSSRLQVL